MHDAILVGIGTAINDDPQLNSASCSATLDVSYTFMPLARHLPAEAQGKLPQPVILDTRLRMPVGSKLLKNCKEGRGRPPWVVCSSDSDSGLGLEEGEKSKRRRALEEAGARILEVPTENGS
jgi:2,5-diamino-6-(ribosylamino)-4(3H)-pyrimidinone 5'-phosphate reductase